MKRKALALLLTLCMALSLMPIQAFAAVPGGGGAEALAADEKAADPAKKTLTIGTAPNAEKLPYKKDLKLSDAKFSDDSGKVNGPDGLPVDGTWRWKSPDTPLDLGENPNCVAVFVPAADPDSYNELTYNITVTVTKGFHAMILKLVEIPVGTTDEITVDLTEDLTDVTATGIEKVTPAENKLVASHRIDGLTVKITPKNIDTVGETADLTATVTSTEYYGFSVSITLKVVAPKKVPAIGGTKAVTVTYGDEVDDKILNDGTVLTATDTDQPVDGSFAWTGVTSYGNAADEKILKAKFIPKDNKTYANVEDIEVKVAVRKADAPQLTAKEVTYGMAASGEKTYSLADLAMPQDAGTLGYSAVKTDDTDNKVIADKSVTVDGNVLKYTLAGKADDASASAKIDVTVTSTNYADSIFTLTVKLNEKQDQPKLTITSQLATYGQDLALEVEQTGGPEGTVTYTVVNGTGEAAIKGNVLTPVKAGTVTVTATKKADGYNDAVSEPTVITIVKAGQSALTLTAAPTEVKVGETVKLSVSGGTTQGAVTYTVDPSENAVVDSKGVLTAKKAGTIQVTATMAGNENYNAVNSAPVTVTIKPDETKPTSAIVTFKVVNGYFSCTGGRYQTEYQLAVTLTDGKGTLGTQYIPTPYPYSGYGYGRWDMVPNTNANGITGDVTYTYYFDPYYYPPVIPDVPNVPSVPGNTVVGPDGSITTTVTRPDGTRVETTVAPDGTRIEVQYQPNGTVVTTEIRPDGTQVITTTDAYGNTTANVYVPSHVGETVVLIPTQKPVSSGTVAVIVNADGTETIVKKSVITDKGVAILVSGRVTVKLRDNTKFFADVQSAGHWAANAIEFVTAREIFNGIGSGRFDPNAGMTRGMLAVALHNLEDSPQGYYGGSFGDVSSNAWYAEAVRWAASQGIVSGFSDGRFAPNEKITREQLAVMLYRYAKSPQVSYTYLSFNDAGQVGGYAEEAVRWAVANGILTGKPGNVLDPQGSATRAEVAAMLQRFLNATIK